MGRKDPEPWPGFASIGVLGFEGIRKMDSGKVLRAVIVEENARFRELLAEGLVEIFREHGDAVFGTLALADMNGVGGEIEILDAEGKHFRKAHTGAVEKARHQQRLALEMGKGGFYFVAGEDDGEAALCFGFGDFAKIADGDLQDFFVEEDEGAEGGVLRRGSNIALLGEISEVGDDGLGAKICGMLFLVKENEAADGCDVGFLRAVRVATQAYGGAYLIEEFRLCCIGHGKTLTVLLNIESKKFLLG